MAEEITLGDLKIRLRLDDKELDVQVKNSKAKMDDLEKRASDLGKKVAIGIAAVAGAVTGAIALALNRADDLSKAAQKIGIGVEQLSKLEYAGRLADVSLDSLTTSIRFLNRNMVAASEGSREASDAFKDLDVSYKNVDGTLRASDEVLADLADRFAAMEEGPRKSALAMQLFGRSGAEMIPFLNEGKAGLKELGDEAERLGLVLDTESAAGAERVNDAFTRLWGGVQGLATRVAVGLLPQLNKFADLVESKEFGEALSTWAGYAVQAINTVVQAIMGLTNMFNAFMANINNKIGDTFAPLEQRSEKTLRRQIENSYRLLNENEPNTDSYNKVLEQLHLEEQALIRIVNLRKSGRDNTGEGASFGELSAFRAPEEEGTGGVFTPGNSALGPSQEELDKQLETLRDSLKTEAQVETDAFTERQAQLKNFLEIGLITKQDYDNLTQRSEMDHWEKMKGIRKDALADLDNFTQMSFKDQAKTIFSELESITAGVKNESDLLFNINKGAAVANAIINTYEGISKSLASYPMPLAGIMAGVHAAAGFAQVSSILATTRNTTTGSAKGLGGAAGAADGATTAASNVTQSSVQYVKGLNPNDLFTGATFKTIAEGLLQYQKDGGQVVFAE